MDSSLHMFVFLALYCSVPPVEAWSGPNVCTQVIQSFRNRQTCIDPACWWTKTVSYPVYQQNYFCCTGWTHNGNEICNIESARHPPICTSVGGRVLWHTHQQSIIECLGRPWTFHNSSLMNSDLDIRFPAL